MRALLPLTVLLTACASPIAELEDGEWLPGGDTTNTLLLGSNAFLRPAANLSPENEGAFYGGNSFFNDAWVEAPASTQNRDGLGPLFNARSCSGCHFRDGRAAPPEDGRGPMVGLLFRLGAQDGTPDPVYGGQLQDIGLPGVPAEGTPVITTTLVPGTYRDGTPWELALPDYTFEDLAYGPMDAATLVSPRVAPQMIGLGLLEAIAEDDLLALEDPDDADRDGISGRAQWREDVVTGQLALGRFGWKGDAPNIRHQSAGAFNGDLGITSALFPVDDCTDAQAECLAEPAGGEPELEDRLLDRVVLYSQAVAVPIRRDWDTEGVLRGKRLFGRIGCDGCHTPSYTTSSSDLPELEGQRIWPYTDLLLHDMGPELADGRPLGEADGQEWKTPPLWGLGLIPEVNGHSRYLHDGRARSLEEAVLWHGGEAEASRERFTRLDADERAWLLEFLASL
ncbi:MAG: thiol oxidoreductase [Alphaproteobacteria bacterium]|nr:thiol oxidoreductase [Alphaproteobacteria bacterium]